MTTALVVLLALALALLCGWIGANVWERLKDHIGEKPAAFIAFALVALLAAVIQPLIAAVMK